MNLSLSVATTPRSARLHVVGDLVYETTHNMVDAVGELLTRHPSLAHLHLDLSELAFCDSAGLSGLLLVRRRTQQAGVLLHLDHRPRFLERILDITGTFDHLVTVTTDAGDPDRWGQGAPGESGVR